jgi:hypothetical protein
MKRGLGIITVILCGFVLGCADSPHAGDLVSEKPEITTVAGTYKFETENFQEINNGDSIYNNATIVLNKNGTFIASNIPRFCGADGCDSIRVSAKGKWHIDSIGTVTTNWGFDKRYWGVKLVPLPADLTSDIGFMGSAPNYKLLLNYDDRDLDQTMIFIKK